MKKVIVSAVIIIAFVLYGALNKHAPITTPALPVTTSSSSQPSPTDTSTQTNTQTTTQSPTASPVIAASGYKDGTYTGSAANAYWGYIQVQATISNGKLSHVNFLQYPSDRGRSIEINQYADPVLSQEAIQAQSAQVDTVSGATDTSEAFLQSLSSALNQAKS